jgi:hypothetical protein
LAKSLLDDFHTRGASSDDLQAGAAARLALYFPEPGGPLVTRRLNELLSGDGQDRYYASGMLWRSLKTDNGAVHALAHRLIDPATSKGVLVIVLNAISRKPGRETEARIREVFEKTEDVDVLLACLEWLPLDGKGLFARLERALRRAEAPGVEGYDQCQGVLDFMIRVDRKKALEACRKHMQGGLPRVLTVLGSLYSARDGELARALAVPLLDDKMYVGSMGGIPRRAVIFNDTRICDYAALVLARTLEEVSFSNPREIEARDREIEAIRKALGGR